ncbi:hypothetical protein AB4Z22_40770, partial [Paenibacillus sp. TAF58]
HLLGRTDVHSNEEIRLIPAQQLWCTQSGQVIGELAHAQSTHVENVERLAIFERSRQALPEVERKKRAIEWLQKRVFSGRQLCDLNPRPSGGGEVANMWVIRKIWWSQKGLLNHCLQFFDSKLARNKLPVTIAIWEGGSSQLEAHAKWIEETCASGRLAMVLNPTGIGPLLPHLNSPTDKPFKRFGMMDRYTDEMMWLGDSMAAIRTFDVLRAV